MTADSHAEIVSINTDEPSAMAAARRVLRENDLLWIKIMSGNGLNDPVWMMFQAMDTKSLLCTWYWISRASSAMTARAARI